MTYIDGAYVVGGFGCFPNGGGLSIALSCVYDLDI